MRRVVVGVSIVVFVSAAAVWWYARSFPFPRFSDDAGLPSLSIDDMQNKLRTLINDNVSRIEEEARLQEAARSSPSVKAAALATTGTPAVAAAYSVPQEEILSGGVPKDGIPSIDEPQFVSVREAGEFLKDIDTGIVYVSGADARFYPTAILVYHEIVNDTVGGKRVLITYCPLCRSGAVFDPLVDGERVEFGVSGKLWNSNLIMYDRKTDSLWSQVLGRAIGGQRTGDTLAVLPSDMMRFGNFSAVYPRGEVLSRKTGVFRLYGSDPYGEEYYSEAGTLFPYSMHDARLQEKDEIVGIVIDETAAAFYPPAVRSVGEMIKEIGGKTIVARYEKEVGAVRMYEKIDGTLERVPSISAFWFSWVSSHPDTELYK